MRNTRDRGLPRMATGPIPFRPKTNPGSHPRLNRGTISPSVVPIPVHRRTLRIHLELLNQTPSTGRHLLSKPLSTPRPTPPGNPAKSGLPRNPACRLQTPNRHGARIRNPSPNRFPRASKPSHQQETAATPRLGTSLRTPPATIRVVPVFTISHPLSSPISMRLRTASTRRSLSRRPRRQIPSRHLGVPPNPLPVAASSGYRKPNLSHPRQTRWSLRSPHARASSRRR